MENLIKNDFVAADFPDSVQEDPPKETLTSSHATSYTFYKFLCVFKVFKYILI